MCTQCLFFLNVGGALFTILHNDTFKTTPPPPFPPCHNFRLIFLETNAGIQNLLDFPSSPFVLKNPLHFLLDIEKGDK